MPMTSLRTANSSFDMNLSTPSREIMSMTAGMSRPSDLPIQVTHHVFVGTKCTHGVCTEINEHGMRTEVAHPLSVGDIVNVDVAFPEGGFRAYARITYRSHDHNRYHYGMYFVELDEAQREQLAELLSQSNLPTFQKTKIKTKHLF